MIKGLGTFYGRTTLTLGIEERNLERLRAGDPIHILKEQMPGAGLQFDILIFYGKDDRELREIIAPAISEHTVIHDPTQRKKQ